MKVAVHRLRKRFSDHLRAEVGSTVDASEDVDAEIRDLLMAIRAADDPTDEPALVAALRTPLYGCIDVELYDWRRRGGSWSLLRQAPDDLAQHPVAGAIAHLYSIQQRIPYVGAADLLSAVVDERRVLDAALGGADARDVWRRVRFVIDQARAWADAGGRGIRRYLAWARLQAAEARVAETILPERDHDAVRIMTVHASKGLEFPITIVSGMTTQPSSRRGVQVVWGDDMEGLERPPVDDPPDLSPVKRTRGACWSRLRTRSRDSTCGQVRRRPRSGRTDTSN